MHALPVDDHLGAVRDALVRHRAVVVCAQPGAGKTTRVPPALVDAGPVILLQPRRVAARAVASRIAAERGWTIGREVGWQIRFERRASVDTRLLVVTEGILTARLQSDPFLTEFNTVIIDEFHERSLHADLAIALARQAWRARDDLRLVVMSATLDVDRVRAFLDDCPAVNVPGRLHPLEITYEPSGRLPDVARRLVERGDGDVLCFLPGAGEIARATSELAVGSAGRFQVWPLHGSLDGSAQDRALQPDPGGQCRIVVATNIAETSLTVPGVRAVVDAGWQKVARYDAARGIDSLETERISQDSADQRAGRAGRLAAGRVVRLWDGRDRLRPHLEPDLQRVDLAGVALAILAWGGQPRTFEWFEAPRADRLDTALALLDRLGATQDGRLTELGRQMQRLPLHPRLARMLIAGGGHASVVRACALLSERVFTPSPDQSTSSDLLSAVDRWEATPPHVKQIARDISAAIGATRPAADSSLMSEHDFRLAVFAAYPDRVARRREAGSVRVKLSNGTGASLSKNSGVLDAEFLVAVDVRAIATAPPTRPGAHLSSPDAGIVQIASAIERDWLVPTSCATRIWFDAASGQVRAAAVDYYDDLPLRERSAPVDDEAAVPVLVEEWQRRGFSDDDRRLLARLAFAGHRVDTEAWMITAAYGQRSLAGLSMSRAVDPTRLRQLEIEAPGTLAVPSGRAVRLHYDADGGATASVKLQELFGLAETPLIGPNRQPVTLELLAPNGRPVQVTRDLRSFWDRTYPEVRRELRGRYPRHPWPEDPWTATPTARTRRRSELRVRAWP